MVSVPRAIQARMTETTYPELLRSIDEFARTLPPRERLARLYGLIAPLLESVEEEDEEFADEQELSTPEAVRGLRCAAAGEQVDVEAIHEHLAGMGLNYSEDQDPERHVISQSAYAAAAWLQLVAGHPLPTGFDDEDILPTFAPSTFTQIVDLLAWTRSGQIYLFWEDAEADPDLGDLAASTGELRGMFPEVAG